MLMAVTIIGRGAPALIRAITRLAAGSSGVPVAETLPANTTVEATPKTSAKGWRPSSATASGASSTRAAN
jgi:hypothetical protein